MDSLQKKCFPIIFKGFLNDFQSIFILSAAIYLFKDAKKVYKTSLKKTDIMTKKMFKVRNKTQN